MGNEMAERSATKQLVQMRHGGRDLEQIIVDTLNRRHTIQGAAEELGVSTRTLRTWMRQLEIVIEPRAVKRNEVLLSR